MRRNVYSGWLRLKGEENYETLREANNLANALLDLKRFKEAKALTRRMKLVARRVLGVDNILTLTMRSNYATALCNANGATLDDLREAVTTFEETERTARRVFGGAHPLTVDIEDVLRAARAALRARGGA